MPISYIFRRQGYKKARIVVCLTLLVVGFLIWHIGVDQSDGVALAKVKTNTTDLAAASTTSSASATSANTQAVSTQLKNDWINTISGRQGDVDIAVYDSANGQTTHYSNVNETFNTASIVKLSILEEVLLKDQSLGQTITADESAEAARMIENSDNDAATDLWNDVGEASAMDSFFTQVGTNSTVAGADAWGLTQTTALDQLKILNVIAYPSTLLTSSSTTTVNELLDQVEADQKWGVSGGVPSGVAIELKDGWLSDSDTNDQYSGTNDWTVNSIGHVHGDGVDYTISVLTEGNPSEQYGIDTIENLSGVTWSDLST
ncbi:MAG: hypothetical protein JWN26_391 [Candidatus Saccharibacteria bacterium]|nr:hypothetical protein [Candidatus Saccharibacteria bacterium]